GGEGQRLGGAPLHPSGAPAGAGAHAGTAAGGHGGWCAHRGGGGRGGRPLAVGTTTAPAPAATPVAPRSRSGGCAEGQAARTFFVARVASAAITTSSRSFFMEAMLAGTRAAVDAPGGSGRTVAAWSGRTIADGGRFECWFGRVVVSPL